jgi:hypothetical protein
MRCPSTKSAPSQVDVLRIKCTDLITTPVILSLTSGSHDLPKKLVSRVLG